MLRDPHDLPRIRQALVIGMALLVPACADRSAEEQQQPPPENPPAEEAASEPAPGVQFAPSLDVDLSRMTETPTGLYIEDIEEGSGEGAQPGQEVAVHYTGWLPSGQQFDSSRDRGEPIRFRLGEDPVIEGWHEGIAGMKRGGRRKLVIPPDLAYGADGRPPVIPPNATLVFDTELVEIR